MNFLFGYEFDNLKAITKIRLRILVYVTLLLSTFGFIYTLNRLQPSLQVPVLFSGAFLATICLIAITFQFLDELGKWVIIFLVGLGGAALVTMFFKMLPV